MTEPTFPSIWFLAVAFVVAVVGLFIVYARSGKRGGGSRTGSGPRPRSGGGGPSSDTKA